MEDSTMLSRPMVCILMESMEIVCSSIIVVDTIGTVLVPVRFDDLGERPNFDCYHSLLCLYLFYIFQIKYKTDKDAEKKGLVNFKIFNY